MSSEKRKRKSEGMNIPIETKRQFIDARRDDRSKKTKRNNEHTNKFAYSVEPRGINVLEYAEARAHEICNLKSAIAEAKKGYNVHTLQKLPRHMRRRAGNHDVKRLPRRLRDSAVTNIAKSNKDVKNKEKKKPNRHQRRKPKNLFEEYKRRQDKCTWLETHIWHAKRCYMKEKWGYKIATKTFSKAVRSSYRAAKSSCLMQDISFNEIIEVTGKVESIRDCMKKLGNITDMESTHNCTKFIEFVAYQNDQYPRGAIGPIKLLWISSIDEATTKCNAVIISHTAISKQVIKEIESFNKTLDADNQISITHHVMDFVLFKLTGTQSASVIQNVLTVDDPDNQKWWTPLFEAEDKTVLNLNVKDPRLYLPKKKQNALLLDKDIPSDQKDEIKEDLNGHATSSKIFTEYSDIWDKQKRTFSSNSKIADHEINKSKAELLYSDDNKPAVESCQIPVCILKTPGNNTNHFAKGFEMILPSNWAMPFWIALVYQGARAGCLEEAVNISYEASILHFPRDYIDTNVGKAVNDEKAQELQNHYNRVPPAKRISYEPLGVRCPYFSPWQDLISQWNLNFKHLTQIDLIKCEHKEFYGLRDSSILQRLKTLMMDKTFKLPDLKELDVDRALVPIRLTSTKNGVPSNNAMLCIPSYQDFLDLQESKLDELTEYNGPKEPQHKGPKHKFPFIYKNHENVAFHNVQDIGRSTHWVMGYLQTGNYSFQAGKGTGVGFVSAIALYYHWKCLDGKEDRNLILFRNTNTLQYRFCEIDIIC
ncbi:ribonucleases P/MRP protein subunit POP1-like isoform X1 [Clytia hemisphaerica]|uniref:Uncharacterized protein n=2 Tax=Clytia hemisphaerica TaxID=252671 RepID=A0A7M5V8U6_9CNID